MPATLHGTIEGATREFGCDQIVTIGRGKDNTIVLPDPKASRNHAIVRCLGDGSFYLMDTGSSNGTLVNGKPVLMPCLLKNSDEIKIGNHVLLFRFDIETPPPPSDGEADEADATVVTVGGSLHEITVLVADIRNFTSISERIPVAMLTHIMARWFRTATEIVESYSGIVDKYIGDAIMVRWIADKNRTAAETIQAALRATHEMSLKLQAMNVEFPELPMPLVVGVGINSGQAVLGNVGMNNRRDYTALGDSVNLAFRFETLSKTLGKNVVIGPDAYQHLPESVWKPNLQSVTIKGRENSIDVCALTFDQIIPLLPSPPAA